MRLDWLAQIARDTGYPVVEVDGWQNRGVSDGYNPAVVVAHHTAGPSGSGDMPSLGIIVNGRSDLPGPLANYGLGRSGTIYVVASGKSNNAGEGVWTVGGVRYDSNYDTVGIEAENDGHQPWPDSQLDSYAHLTGAILKRLGRSSAYLCGHKEWATPAGRKVDPHDIPMPQAREVVGAIIEGEDMPSTEEIRKIVRDELDRPIEGAWREEGSFWGIQQASLVAPVGNSGKNISEHLAKIYAFTDTLEATVKRIEDKVDALEAGSGGVSMEDVNDAISGSSITPPATRDEGSKR